MINHVVVVVIISVILGVLDGMLVAGRAATVLAAGSVVPGLVAVIRCLLTPRVWYYKQVEDTIKHVTRKANWGGVTYVEWSRGAGESTPAPPVM